MKKLLIALTCTAGLLVAGSAQAGIFGGGGEQQDQSLFQKMDENQDGQVSQQEFSDYSFEDQDKTQLFNMLDEQGKGQIDQQQWQMKQGESGGSMQEMGSSSGGSMGSMGDTGTQQYGATEGETGGTTGSQEYGSTTDEVAPPMTGDTPGSPQGDTQEYGTTEGETGGMTSGGSSGGAGSGQ